MAAEEETKKKFSRRKFLQRGAIVFGGVIVATYAGRGPIRRYLAQTMEGLDLPASLSTQQPDFWFEVLPDNTILFKSPKVEMGQGIFTGLAMLAAEELEMPFDRIRVEHANTSTGAVDALATGGSNTTSSMFVPIREVAATMREMLRLAAAKQWNVQPDAVTARAGTLTSGHRTATYAAIAASTKEWNIPKTPALKPVSSFQFVGKDVKRIDLIPKVMGKPLFALDRTLPGMLHAVILQSPYIGGTLKSLDTREAAASTDVVRIVQEADLVAVVAKNRYAAEMALRKIKAEWNIPKKWQQKDFESIVTVGNGSPVVVQSEGDAASIIEANASTRFRQEYRTGMAAHAHMEPNGTLAHVEAEKATIVIGTQMPGVVLGAVAKALGLKKEQVTIEIAYLGGGFGRRGNINNATQAALISRQIGKPVHVFNTREQEFMNAVYRPNTHHVLQARISPEGEVDAVLHEQASPDMVLEAIGGNIALTLAGADFMSAGHGASLIYQIPNKEATIWQNKLPIPTGIWRSVGMYPNTFAIESFMNELASETDKDPIELRINLLNGTEKINKRYRNVLETLRHESGWKNAKPAGIGRGVAICNDRKTIAAAVAEVMVSNGKILVRKITNVLDAGMIINPEGIRQQVEGCVMMGISAALYEQITVKDGQLAVSNFHEYPMATLADCPEIGVFLLPGADEPYGVGEPPIAPIAPAIAAAVFDLTGQRLRSLPLKLS